MVALSLDSHLEMDILFGLSSSLGPLVAYAQTGVSQLNFIQVMPALCLNL